MLCNQIVSQILQDRNKVILQAFHHVEYALDIMQKENVSAIGVYTFTAFSGIFTRTNFIQRVWGQGLQPSRTLLHDVMTPNPHTISPDTGVHEAYRTMLNYKIGHLPVMEQTDQTLLGILTEDDLHHALYNDLVMLTPQNSENVQDEKTL